MKSHMIKQGKYVFMENITNKKNHLGVVCGIFSNQCLAGAGGLGGPACHQVSHHGFVSNFKIILSPGIFCNHFQGSLI